MEKKTEGLHIFYSDDLVFYRTVVMKHSTYNHLKCGGLCFYSFIILITKKLSRPVNSFLKPPSNTPSSHDMTVFIMWWLCASEAVDKLLCAHKLLLSCIYLLSCIDLKKMAPFGTLGSLYCTANVLIEPWNVLFALCSPHWFCAWMLDSPCPTLPRVKILPLTLLNKSFRSSSSAR